MSPHRWSGKAGPLLPAVALACLLAAAPARAELIVNGGFETPSILPAPFTAPIGVGNPFVTGWQVVSGNVEIVSFLFSAPFEGNQWLDLHGLTPGAIQQTFATTPGETYLLSFAFANNPNSVFASAQVDVFGGTGPIAPLLLRENVAASGSTFAQMQYQTFTGSFVAASATTTLRFTSTSPADPFSGLALDAVSVQQVPEPSALALLGLGAAGALGLAWRRRRRAT